MRIRRRLSRKYWKRANDRTNQLLHRATNEIVEKARSSGAAIALEDITGINKMYGKGNGKGRDYRFRMNTWPHRKAYVMLDYKAAAKGSERHQADKGRDQRVFVHALDMRGEAPQAG